MLRISRLQRLTRYLLRVCNTNKSSKVTMQSSRGTTNIFHKWLIGESKRHAMRVNVMDNCTVKGLYDPLPYTMLSEWKTPQPCFWFGAKMA
ncbi:hypothetical protein RRG08_030917 [Elysia crispata]|uniref:Uncharacterized protein n=1 Tax=Elysia crispata TaxID=231223 RepID=A0AAE1DV32_9GAST|nr:hypothetical protein RRG08_030917 [Elysia crispata]